MIWRNTLDLPKNVTHMGDVISIAPSSDSIQPSSTPSATASPCWSVEVGVHMQNTKSTKWWSLSYRIPDIKPQTTNLNQQNECTILEMPPPKTKATSASWVRSELCILRSGQACKHGMRLAAKKFPSCWKFCNWFSTPKLWFTSKKGGQKWQKQPSKALCQRQLSSNSSMDSLSSTRTPFHYIQENSQVASIHTWNAGSQTRMPYLFPWCLWKSWSPKLTAIQLWTATLCPDFSRWARHGSM